MMTTGFLHVRTAEEGEGRRESTANDDCVGDGAAMMKRLASMRRNLNFWSEQDRAQPELGTFAEF